MKRNPSQQRAIAHLSGPMMVLAGPGSGKTSVIVERTAYMTKEGGISPANILVVTFSRAAAKEMKERFLNFTGQEYTPITFGTFHGVFYGILKQAYGFTAANILAEEEKMAILRELAMNYGGDLAEEGDFSEEVAKEISVVKGNRISLEYYYSSCCPDEVFRQIYREYIKICQARRKLDFDDMILYCYELFVQRKDILEAWQKKFQYILVDEFQDINQLQYDIVRMLAKPQNNLFIVGDDDQSIYHFRGARPEIMLNFTRDYPDAETVTLDVNYRCSGQILSAAMHVIGENKKRFSKKLSTPNQVGKAVQIREFQNPREEYLAVVSELRERMENGERLLNDDVLNGTVVMILFTCVISSLVTERSARRFALNEDTQPEDKGVKKTMEQILIPVANPETIENLVNLALVIKDTKQKNGMIALNVINDNNSSENKELQGKRNLEKAAMIAAAADVPVTMVSRYDLNIASGIIHTIKEYEATDVVIGLHRKANIVDSFFGNLAESLLKGTHREVMIAKFLMPVNTLRRIIIAVPPKAEFETGFSKWVEHFCRMGSILGCRVHFFANERTLMRLQQLVKKKFSGTPTEFSMLEEWGDLLLLTGQVNYDHLFVVISARRGSISYDPSFERLPAQLSKYFSNNSLIILYPDQFGDPQEIVSFSDPRGYNESQHYEKVGKWFYKWFKKS